MRNSVWCVRQGLRDRNSGLGGMAQVVQPGGRGTVARRDQRHDGALVGGQEDQLDEAPAVLDEILGDRDQGVEGAERGRPIPEGRRQAGNWRLSRFQEVEDHLLGPVRQRAPPAGIHPVAEDGIGDAGQFTQGGNRLHADYLRAPRAGRRSDPLRVRGGGAGDSSLGQGPADSGSSS